jgi:lysozyme
VPNKLYGIDVSVHQGDINWNAVAKDHEFAWFKATEGQDFADETATKSRVDAMEKAGIYLGPYHFAWPSEPEEADAKAEIDDFWNKSRKIGALRPGQLPGVLDLEANRPDVNYLEAQAWVRKAYRRYKWHCKQQGFRRRSRLPVVYTGSWWRDFLRNPIILTRCKLWLAAYVKDPGPYKPKAFKRITWWQYTSSAHVDGVDGNVDRNIFFGDKKALKRRLIRK